MVKTDVIYERNPDFIYRNIADEAVLLPIHQNVFEMDSFYTLNSVGAFIWDHLDQPCTSSQLLETMMAEYDAEPNLLQADLEHFLDEMTSIGAIRKV